MTMTAREEQVLRDCVSVNHASATLYEVVAVLAEVALKHAAIEKSAQGTLAKLETDNA